MLCLKDMKINGDNNEAAANNLMGATIGGLTDMFSLNILILSGDTKCGYMTTDVIEALDYVKYLLLLCMPVSQELMDLLVRKNPFPSLPKMMAKRRTSSLCCLHIIIELLNRT
mmetsp:Transcript_29288/g.41751  ORF Transcript_29288/g.41751 Transcript_29288/m.41751 type:complete len:113 (-) Transcript_29288:492-830(-)